MICHFSAEKDPKTYSEAFDKLTQWVDNALDLYRVSRARIGNDKRSPETAEMNQDTA